MQRISKSINAMCNKTSKINFVLLGSMLLLCLVACSDGPTFHGDHLWNSNMLSSLSGSDQNKVMKDTITPPSNPMNEKPVPDDTYHFRGVLSLEYFAGELYCVIKSTRNDYFLVNEQRTYLLRLNDPILSKYAVGDTIVVTAQPMKMLRDLSLTTYYIQSNK